jgi:peroxiredoxin
MAITVGMKAPDFTLFDTDRKQRTLKEFLGRKTLLAFYPGAFTGVCTKEMCALRDAMTAFNEMQAQVVGISVDAPAANKGFADVNRIAFPLLSDVGRTVSRMYCGTHQDFGGVTGLETSKRAVFLLDAGGTVRHAWISENPAAEPDYAEIRSALAKI